MTGTASTPASPALSADVRDRLDRDIAALQAGERSWIRLTLEQRARLLRRVRDAVGAVAAEWADTAAASKGLPPEHPMRGEEWLGGPYHALTLVDAMARAVDRLAAGRSPLDGIRIDEAPGGRVRARTFPLTGADRLLLSGFSGEVWLEPGVTAERARREAGLAQLDPTAPGGVGLVLGAGNISAIPVADVLYELFAHNRVSLLKVNPTQDPLVPVFTQALAPLIGPGFLRIVTGGPEVGEHLTGHAAFAHVHITGSAQTFDAIVWGTGDAAARRRAADDPRLPAPISAELGGVSPIIVVPGAWSAADLRFQAEHVATMRLVNAGHNCIAGQIVIISADWPQREAFLAELRRAYSAAPERPVWYPRSDERMQAIAEAYPDAEWSANRTRALVDVRPGGDPTAVESVEYFAPVLGVVELPGLGQEFLDAAVAHANERLAGTLGANVIVDPTTETALGDGFERAIADLRYGGIAINTWTAFNFTTPGLSWGAFPGGDIRDVGSGIGVVHNALLINGVERSIGRGPFRPFPRLPGSGGVFTILPTPPWFVSSRTGAEVCEGLTRYLASGSVATLVSTLAKALRA